jgi:outer membrane protein OmpA-like peptidoglycan-associated protein
LLAKFGRIGRAVFEGIFSGLPTRGHMLRPVGGSGGRWSVLARLVLSGAFVLTSAVLVRAASNPGGDAPQQLIELAEGSSETYGPEQRAQELYLDAMEKLDAGHDAWARRTFETLIARFPKSAAAASARQQLGLLYRGAPPRDERPESVPVKAAAPTTQLPASLTVGASPAWDQELRRNASIQARMRNEAGDRVFFSAGSAELGSRARTALSAQAEWLNRWHEFEAAIEGHADEPGSEDENLRLSVARAEAVRRRLVEEGVEAGRLAIVAQGRMQRVATCAGGGCAAQNRRAVTLVFANGTRERLGLTAPAPLPTLVEPQAQAAMPVTQTVNTPPTAERVGVAR